MSGNNWNRVAVQKKIESGARRTENTGLRLPASDHSSDLDDQFHDAPSGSHPDLSPARDRDQWDDRMDAIRARVGLPLSRVRTPAPIRSTANRQPSSKRRCDWCESGAIHPSGWCG